MDCIHSAGSAGVEVCDAVDPEADRFAVDGEMPVSVFQGRLGDPGEAARPVVAVAGDQADAVGLAHHDQAVAV